MLTFNPHAQFKSPSGPYFFIVYKSRGQNQWTPLYKSEVRKPRGNVVSWSQCALGLTDLCDDNIEKEFKIEVFLSQTSGAHKNLGFIETSTGVLKTQPNSSFPDKKKANFTFRMSDCKFEKKFSFLEYVFGGCDIDLSIAIDFTLSNGQPSSPESLHYFDPARN